MPSAWINHVKKFATEHKIKFGEALADKRCSASYKSLQTSTPNKGPMSFVPVDAVPKKKSAKRKTGSSKSSSKRTQSKKTKTNSKSKVTKSRGRSRGRGKKSSTKTQSAGGKTTYEKLSIYPCYTFLLPKCKDTKVNEIFALYLKKADTYPKHVFYVNSTVNNTLNRITYKDNKLPTHFQSIKFDYHFKRGRNDAVMEKFNKDSELITPNEIYTNVTKEEVGSNNKLRIKFNMTSKKN